MRTEPRGSVAIVVAVAMANTLAFVLTACSSTPPTPTPADLDAPPQVPSTTQYGRLFEQVQDDGSVSQDVALQAFSIAIAPLPGVADPLGDEPTTLERMDGTFAIDWLMPFRDTISAEQRAAMDAALAPGPNKIDLDAEYRDRAALTATAMTGGFGEFVAAATPAVDSKIYDKALIDARVFFEGSAALNRSLSANTTTALFNPTHESDEPTAYAYTHTTKNISGGIDCEFHVEPELAVIADVPSVQASMAHEMFHCFQNDLLNKNGRDNKGLPGWIVEGGAEWAGEAALGPSKIGRGHWETYLLSPGQTLFSRNYSAIGFYEHLVRIGINPWPKMDQMLLDVDSDSAFLSAGADSPGFMDTWASGLLRDSSINGYWNEQSRWQTSVAAEPEHYAIGVGETVTLSAKAVSNVIARVTTTADVIEAQIKGHARSHGNLDVMPLDNRWFCARADGNCDCPAGQHLDTARFFEALGPEFPVGVSGDLKPAGGTLTGHSLNEYCKPGGSTGPSPQSPCTTGCGGSNGDPHMRTIDGSRYDLQAAGEYVLLRGPDRGIEIQSRQEPRGTSVSINTAIAAQLNGHRVAFYAETSGVPEVRVDGVVVAPDAVASVDLGPDTNLSAYQRGYELDFPDGTKLWALSVGGWGINALVLPSDDLRQGGVGLIARVPSDARYRVPALPDGTQVEAPATRDDRYHVLYDVLAPAWRVTDETTLFDYDAGKTTDSYAVAEFPPITAPLDVSEMSSDDLAAAFQVCGGVSDPELLNQCAFDVSVTGEQEFAALYIVSDDLESQGVASLDQPQPPSTPPPPPTAAPSGGPLPSGINFVADHLAQVGARLLAPNGRLYVNVATQAGFGADPEYALLEIDPATGQTLVRAPSAAAGMLAWGAGSVWAGEFGRADIGQCQVSRLDPATLAVQATVTTVCGDRLLTVMATIGDDVWFTDSTGAAADGTGVHLRRINPTTNAIDPSPTSNLTLPVAVPFILVPGSSTVWSSTSAGLILGSRQTGLYRLLIGSDTFDPLGIPGNGLGWFPAGDGVWTETGTGENGGLGSVASFYNGSDQPTLQVGFDGYLEGADDDAIYVEFQENIEIADTLVRYPSDGSAPSASAFGGFVPNSFGGQTTLGYSDSSINPLLFADGLGVKSWAVPGATDELQQQLLVQVIGLP